MKKNQSTRGRRPGQELKLHTPDRSPTAPAFASMQGNYAPGVTQLLKELFWIGQARKFIEESPMADLQRQIQIWRKCGQPDLSEPLPLPPITKRTEQWRKGWRRSTNFVKWLLGWKGFELAEVLTTLLEKLEKRDATFFRDIARRLENPVSLEKPAEVNMFFVAWSQMTKELPPNPKNHEVGDYIQAKTGHRPDRKQIRELRRRVGLPNRPAGRPPKK